MSPSVSANPTHAHTHSHTHSHTHTHKHTHTWTRTGRPSIHRWRRVVPRPYPRTATIAWGCPAAPQAQCHAAAPWASIAAQAGSGSPNLPLAQPATPRPPALYPRYRATSRLDGRGEGGQTEATWGRGTRAASRTGCWRTAARMPSFRRCTDTQVAAAWLQVDSGEGETPARTGCLT